MTHPFPSSSYDGRSRREIELSCICSSLVVSSPILTAWSSAAGLLFRSLFCSFSFFRGQLLFLPYLFLQSCSSGFSQSCLSSFSISSCSPAVLDMRCPVAGSFLCPTVVHLVPGRGNGPWDPASNLKDSSWHAAFYQPAGERAVSSQDSRNEGQEV